jgi:hypothetical protein
MANGYEKEAEFLKANGWYTYYNESCWLHPKIVEMNKNLTDLGFLVKTTEQAIKQTKEWGE